MIEALNADDNDLFSILKSQWAHRFGVDSLEELQNLDLTLLDQKNDNKDDQSQESFVAVDKEIFIKDVENEEKVIITETQKVVNSLKDENKDLIEIKSPEKVDKEYNLNKAINTVSESKKPPKVKALIPLPPKPKYGYLKKWIFRS